MSNIFYTEIWDRILSGEDPLNLILNIAKDYFYKDIDNDIKTNYDKKEIEWNLFERKVFTTFFELYTDIIPSRVKEQPLENWLPQEGRTIIMDALSLREVPYIVESLEDWDIVKYDVALSSIPSTTEGFCLKVFNTDAPSKISRDDFLYISMKDLQGSILINDRVKYIWTEVPDKFIHTGNLTIDASEVVTKTINVIKSVLESVKDKEVFITSDHGYMFVDIPTENFTWKADKDIIDNVKRKLDGKRYINKDVETKPIINTLNGMSSLCGRFYWNIQGSQGDKSLHGSTSVMEIARPIIKLVRK